ncbi:MAG: hypothetical protein M3Y08_20425, partial [Fibrobacterota bacterium]|nr:hypothetical protein [Fibrobacterota bacterium]
MPGKVILKGLAFQLTSSKAVLIAGADGQKINGSLLIDSCFIFADSLDNTFISWIADNASSIEVRNSFLVVKGSKANATRMALSAGTIRMNNNLINFSGAVSATNITKRFEFFSNTVNRTQLELTGKLDGGVRPVMEFTKNLFAHHGGLDAFGGLFFWVLSHAGFDEGRSPIQNNKIYKTWNGFDFPLNRLFDANSSNKIIDTIVGKPSSELWNWYTEALDLNQTGLLSGDIKLVKYNVMPGQSTFSWVLQRGDLSVTFQPAPYPRTIRLDTLAAGLPDTVPSFRRIYPSMGAMQFGPFRTEKIVLKSKAVYGKPVLLADDSTTKFTVQSIPGQFNESPSVFINGSPLARRFILVNAGNTSRGDSIRPQVEDLNSLDKLLFVKVDSAGQTVIKAPLARNLPNDLRSLLTSFEVKTSALIDSKIILGAKEIVTPFSPDKVFWYFEMADTLVQAVKGPGPDSQKYVASARFNSAKGEQAFLVERLSVPKGGKTIPITDGSIQAESVNGFQLKVDSNHVLESLGFGKQTKGYSFTWPLKASTDLVTLTLTAIPDQELYVKVGANLPEPWNLKPDSLGNIKIPIPDIDTAKVFFLAIKWNVLKDKLYDSLSVDSVTVKGFESVTSGRLGFDPLAPGFQDSLGVIVKDFRFLGGRRMRALSINPKAPFGMSFSIKESQGAAKIEAYFHNGLAWSVVPVSGIQIGKRFTLAQVPAN